MKRKLKKIMLIVLIIITAVIVLTVLSVFVSRLINSDKNKIDTKTGIQESTYIDIDGMKQYVQIRGKNTKNPVMIFIHGGPASPMGYVSAYYQRELESELTIINYDQRGCGRTYYANNCDANSNIDLLVDDLNKIVEYAKERFGKEKVIIAGHSWGTVIGSIYIQKHPENAICYIGISQITNLAIFYIREIVALLRLDVPFLSRYRACLRDSQLLIQHRHFLPLRYFCWR